MDTSFVLNICSHSPRVLIELWDDSFLGNGELYILKGLMGLFELRKSHKCMPTAPDEQELTQLISFFREGLMATSQRQL